VRIEPRPTALLDEERVERLFPGISVAAGGGGKELRVHRDLLSESIDHITHSGGRDSQHDAGIVNIRSGKQT
jgi:hypothetical protein